MGNQSSKQLSFCERLFESVVVAGVIIFSVGIYYAVVKAVVQYQDPPLELQIEYIINERIATQLMAIGAWIMILGVLLRGFVWLAEKRGYRRKRKR